MKKSRLTEKLKKKGSEGFSFSKLSKRRGEEDGNILSLMMRNKNEFRVRLKSILAQRY